MGFCIKVLAFGVGVLLGRGDACRCAGRELCEYIEESDVVLHATALSRSDQDDINDDDIYTVDTITLYKSEPNVKYAQEISFTTAGNSAACGIYLDIGEEYLIHLYRYDGQLTGNSCGGTKSWSSVSEAEMETLQDGCDDLCEAECGEFQECLVYEGYEDPVYYCADVCDPSPCEPDEECTLHPRKCVEPCPPLAGCTPVDDLCGGTCGEFQECLVYMEGFKDEEYYCADVCDPSPCEADETCSLKKVVCVREPCPPLANCAPSTDNPCNRDCQEFQECLVYMEGTEAEEEYCADVCEPSPCEDGEECYFQDLQCVRAPCPLPAACRQI